MGLRNIKKILALLVLASVSLSPVFGKDIIKITSNGNHLQNLIDNAKENSVIIIPKGIYKEPIEIRKPLTLKGTSAKDCILDVASEKPVILIDTKGEVILENLTVTWQRLTAQRDAIYNASLVITNAQAKLSNCHFFANEMGALCESAIAVSGISDVVVDKCLTSGFQIGLHFQKGTKGLVSNCVLSKPSRCGISVLSHSKVAIKDSIIADSEHRGIYNGGGLSIENSLIINTKHSGIHTEDGNTTIYNSLFMNNDCGIASLKKASVLLENSIVSNSKRFGIITDPNSCLTIRNNIISGNPIGISIVKKANDSNHTNLVLTKNTFWQNGNNAGSVNDIGVAICEDPCFQDAVNGDFTVKSRKIRDEKQGLSNPSVIKSLWITLANTTEYFAGLVKVNEGVIAGKVLDTQGTPVVGAAVVVCDQNTGVLINKHTSRPFTENKRVLYDKNALDIAYAITDSQGCFSVNNLKKGEYRVFSQSWENIKDLKDIFEKNGKVVKLHGIANNIKVPSSKAENLKLHPLGNGTLHIMPNNSSLTIISTAPPCADPVLMFWSLGDDFLQNIIGGNCRSFLGETIVHGIPEGKVYIAVYNYDQEPGFGIATANIFANTITDVNISIIASWTDACHQPPERLKSLFNEVVEKNLQPSELFGKHAIDIVFLENLGDILTEIGPLERRISLPSGNKATIADILAVFRYAKIQEIVEEKKRNQEINQLRKSVIVEKGSYEESFYDLYFTLGEKYPSFKLKNINWNEVGEQLLPKTKEIENDEQFGLLCMELVACLKDSHAHLLNGEVNVPLPPLPRFDPGLICLEDDRGKPIVYHIDPNSPAAKTGVKIGMTVVKVNDKDAEVAINDTIKQISKYVGYSSVRYLRYNAYRWFIRRMVQGATVKLEMADIGGKIYTFELPATMGIRYAPRLPVPNPDIDEFANVSWKILDNQIGYIYVRRIRNDLIELLNKSVEQLKHTRGIIIDVRGNSGGGFDFSLAHSNFALDGKLLSGRPQFKGPLAILVDARCISAGEGWASWFVVNKRARLFGETTAGASSRKITYELKNGLYKVKFPVKFYKGYLDRPIEYYGLKPDVSILQNARDLAEKRDTVLEAAKKYLMTK